MSTLVKVLELNSVELRADVKDALNESSDQYNAMQEAIYKPQLLFAAKWTEENIPNDDDRVRLMGWASLGKRTLGAPILGMFVVTEKKFVFVRDDSTAKTGHTPIQVYDLDQVSSVQAEGFLGLRKVSFVHGGEDIKFERIQKDNAKRIVGYLTKEK